MGREVAPQLGAPVEDAAGAPKPRVQRGGGRWRAGEAVARDGGAPHGNLQLQNFPREEEQQLVVSQTARLHTLA